ncbi:SDR family oxidoreductase [Dietzia sp. PP-33]|jgi:short-subunit dehydrogenase|uniref:SDR family NAD(P)-dependent oxidoreductase n=1 Tax=Dietzia sp. PP-33 TaxID=2957500 RepID=UPI0029A80AA9|nr:SDR family oxidoreductase [Dietzia sp. PP-33]MDX2356583.1 SDR family oxidoreductase [Dietzia sp. PP-33]
MKPLHHDRQTVLITGASSGIGAEFARRLAGEGSSLVLVARRLDRLDSLAAELTAQHHIEVETIAADLAQHAPGEDLLAEVERRGIHVTSVINNAGFGIWGEFHESHPGSLRDMVAVDITAVMDISRAFIPQLRRNGDGYLLNITSLAAYSSIPMQGAYSAAKAFVLSFTESLWAETRDTGVRVLAFAPGITRTEFFDVSGGDSAGPSQSPAEVVTGALRVLERRDPPPSQISGHRNHLIAVLPRFLTRRRAVLLTGALTMRGQRNA